MSESRDVSAAASSRKRFQAGREAVVVLDAGGAIQSLTPAARRLLDYQPGQPVKPSFFAHVHRFDLYQVMRDVAEMTFHGRQEAAWQVRLRTGPGQWHCYDATVGNQLEEPEHAIFVHLKDPVA